MIPVYFKMIPVYFKMIPESIHFFIFWPNKVEIENSKNMASLTYVPRYGIKQKKFQNLKWTVPLKNQRLKLKVNRWNQACQRWYTWVIVNPATWVIPLTCNSTYRIYQEDFMFFGEIIYKVVNLLISSVKLVNLVNDPRTRA